MPCRPVVRELNHLHRNATVRHHPCPRAERRGHLPARRRPPLASPLRRAAAQDQARGSLQERHGGPRDDADELHEEDAREVLQLKGPRGRV